MYTPSLLAMVQEPAISVRQKYESVSPIVIETTRLCVDWVYSSNGVGTPAYYHESVPARVYLTKEKPCSLEAETDQFFYDFVFCFNGDKMALADYTGDYEPVLQDIPF